MGLRRRADSRDDRRAQQDRADSCGLGTLFQRFDERPGNDERTTEVTQETERTDSYKEERRNGVILLRDYLKEAFDARGLIRRLTPSINRGTLKLISRPAGHSASSSKPGPSAERNLEGIANDSGRL